MQVPVTEEMQDERHPLDIRIEERLRADYDLSGQDKYVDFEAIDGTVFIEFDVNRGEIMNRIERGQSPTLRDKINSYVEDWGFSNIDPGTIELIYGKILFTGAEPIDGAPEVLELFTELTEGTIRETSPSELNREIRMELEYNTTYESLKSSINNYLKREGIHPDEYEFGAPIHIQARADPRADEENDIVGTQFTITITNNRPVSTIDSVLRVSMHQSIGREVQLMNQADGGFDPDKQELVMTVPELDPNFLSASDSNTAELSFLVPPSAGRDLEVLEGSVELQSSYTVSAFMPYAVLDAGGNLLYKEENESSSDRVDIKTKSTIEGHFSTPVSDITVGEGAEITKRLNIKGVTPEQAKKEIEEILTQRGISADSPELKDNRESREGVQVTTYQGRFTNGSVIVEDTRISISIGLNGHRRTGEIEAEREESAELPAQRRSVTTEYGRTGVDINGRGSDLEKVDDYISDLRDEIRLALESISTEV